jgi:predicted phosphodiesterase
MRIAVIADIHSNLEALYAVLGRISELRADEILCLGDIVGYNANPNECVAIIREKKIFCVLGNHDACAAGLEEPDNFTPLARQALFWTRSHLTETNSRFLAGLPRESAARDVFLVHGSIHDTNRYLYHHDQAVDNFHLMAGLAGEISLAFFGHTHIRMMFREQDGGVSGSAAGDALELSQGSRFLINPGSVGQPRDGDPRAAFLLYDSRERVVAFHRAAYDIQRCQGKIIFAGLPPQLADRIAWGR